MRNTLMVGSEGSRPFSRLRVRAGRIAAAGGSFVAVAACAAAFSAPAQAATSVCRPEGVGWSSAPFSAKMTGTICDSGATGGSGSCPGGAHVVPSSPLWADPFVSVTGITDGCYHVTSYGGAESMWTNISIKVTDPLEPWDSLSGTVWLRIAMTSNGTTYKQTGASVNLLGALADL